MAASGFVLLGAMPSVPALRHESRNGEQSEATDAHLTPHRAGEVRGYGKLTSAPSTGEAADRQLRLTLPDTCAVARTDPPLTTIADVQGDGPVSPHEGETVSVVGAITLCIHAEKGVRGCFLQSITDDGDPLTSEALYLRTQRAPPQGRLILVSGTVEERFRLTSIGRLRRVQDCGTAPEIGVTEVVVAPDTPRDFEPWEAMLVRIAGPLQVVENAKVLRYGELGLGFGRPFTVTNFKSGGERTLASTAGAMLLILDDGSHAKQPDPLWYEPSGTHRVGTAVSGLTGVLGFGFGAFRLHPVDIPDFANVNPRANPQAKPADGLRVVGFNVLNYFTTLAHDAQGRTQQICGPGRDAGCRGARTAAERQRQRAKLIATLAALDGDIVGLVEVENTDDAAIEDLVAGLNASVGGHTYAWVRSPFTGYDVIRVALIYRQAAVQPVAPALATDGRIDRGYATFKRPALAQTFATLDGALRLSVVVNHFKSKGSCPGDGRDPNADHGQGCWNALRREQARQLLRFVRHLQAADQSPHVLVIGDLNAYGGEDPIRILEAGGLTDLIADRLPSKARYSYYTTHGRRAFGYLDHALASNGLARRVQRVVIWHSNTDEPLSLRYSDVHYHARWHQPDPYGASDHDPILIDIRRQ